ncbi:MarR family transcriptional regulator [Candidatus Woesearchaeota archaeon]|nr:MarR family transcriptional regulator [Candidatus Woesearchaeota archaeon]
MGNVEGATLDIEFILNSNKAHQTLSYNFSKPIIDNSLEYTIASDIDSVNVLANGKEADFEISQNEEVNTIKINSSEPINDLQMSFNVNDVIFKNGNTNHFFTELSLNKTIVSDISVKAVIPAGYGLYDNSFKPESGAITSDGQNVVVEWDDVDTSKPLLFSVKYRKVTFPSWILWTLIVSSLTILIILLYFQYQQKTEKAMLYGFREDEKKALVFIKTHKNILQKELQNEFKFSRAKSTRIVKRLEEKGLIKKEEFGRTNKIMWRGEFSEKKEDIKDLNEKLNQTFNFWEKLK